MAGLLYMFSTLQQKGFRQNRKGEGVKGDNLEGWNADLADTRGSGTKGIGQMEVRAMGAGMRKMMVRSALSPGKFR